MIVETNACELYRDSYRDVAISTREFDTPTQCEPCDDTPHEWDRISMIGIVTVGDKRRMVAITR